MLPGARLGAYEIVSSLGAGGVMMLRRFLPGALTLAIVLALAMSPTVAGGPANVQERPPNILLVIADDWSYPHAGAYGDRAVATPAFDRVAKEGALFTRAFTASPSCTPSRAALLTGQPVHRLAEGGNLWGSLPARFEVYPDLLECAGYHVGHTGKGWGPGQFEPGGRSRNPAGPRFASFDEFLGKRTNAQPFAFWFGSNNPHRPYEAGSGVKAGIDPSRITVPPFLPDTAAVRSDLADYYAEVQRYDAELATLLATLERLGEIDNTLIIVTSDNGMPFPRAKANLYDAGARMPLAMRWPARIKRGTTIDAFVSLTDLAPTILASARVTIPADIAGRSVLPLVDGKTPSGWDRAFTERERHANVRAGDASYPARAIRTADYLYVRNYRPDRWPAGDPTLYFAVGPFGDIDDGPTKQLLLERRDDAATANFFRLSMAKRPADELYDLKKDPGQLTNVVADAAYAPVKARLAKELAAWQRATGDPRAIDDDDRWDRYPYYGARAKPRVQAIDASGVWSLRLLTSAGESAARATVTLKQDGETLTGTCVIEQTEQELTVIGQVKNETLAWRCVGKESFETSFTSSVDATGRQMTGEWTTHAARGTFKGSRPPK